jgi:hypothetical protein
LTQDSSKNATFGGMYSNFLDLLRRIPAPTRKHYPINEEAVIPPEIIEDIQRLTSSPSINGTVTAPQLLQDPITFFAGSAGHRDACDIGLYRLHAPALRGTVAQAYSLLASLVAKLGWDQLLAIRSSTFVMEDEYKEVKKKVVGTSSSLAKSANGETAEEPVVQSKPWSSNSQLTVSMFDNKRLCERWLDTMFMVLYEVSSLSKCL